MPKKLLKHCWNPSLLLLLPATLLIVLILTISTSLLNTFALLSGTLLTSYLLNQLAGRTKPLPIPALPSLMMDQVLQRLPPACQENEQELLERTAEHLVSTWIASWYPRTPGPVLKSTVKRGLARMVKALDQLDVGLLIGDWSRVVARQLAKSRVASLDNSQPVLEHPIFRGR